MPIFNLHLSVTLYSSIIILPWSVSCSNCIMLWWPHPDSNDGRISALDSINSGVPYPGTIDSRECWPPAGVRGKATSLGILSSKVPVPRLAVSHIPVSGCSATKQTECVDFSTYVFNVITGLNGNENYVPLTTIEGYPTKDFAKISLRIAGCLKISHIFPSDALDFSIFFVKPYSFPRIFGIDLLSFIMSHNFRTVFFPGVTIPKAAESFGERSLGTYTDEPNEG